MQPRDTARSQRTLQSSARLVPCGHSYGNNDHASHIVWALSLMADPLHLICCDCWRCRQTCKYVPPCEIIAHAPTTGARATHEQASRSSTSQHCHAVGMCSIFSNNCNPFFLHLGAMSFVSAQRAPCGTSQMFSSSGKPSTFLSDIATGLPIPPDHHSIQSRLT